MRPTIRRVSPGPSGKRLATVDQHREAAELAHELGVPKPFFFWSRDAEKEIARLETQIRQPSLSGFAASTGGGG